MTAVLLALAGAAAYGLSDFVGGLAARRAPAWSVAWAAGVGGGLAMILLGAVTDGSPTAADMAWGAVAGIGNGFGTAFLYRGLAAGRMGVVAPVSGVVAAVLPVAVAVLTGERPGVVVWAGIAVALPAIWLVAREPVAPVAPGTGGALDGLLAGLGFGGLFAAVGQVSEGAGLWPLAANQLVGVVAIIVIATTLGSSWVPRQRVVLLGAAGGVLGALATLAFTVSTQQGLLSVSAVVVSLYPAFTILLAATVLHERVHRAQAVGLGLCAVAVALVAGG